MHLNTNASLRCRGAWLLPAFVLFVFAGCSKRPDSIQQAKAPQPASSQVKQAIQQTWTLDGSMFIVMQNGEASKLALVPIAFYRESQFLQHLTNSAPRLTEATNSYVRTCEELNTKIRAEHQYELDTLAGIEIDAKSGLSIQKTFYKMSKATWELAALSDPEKAAQIKQKADDELLQAELKVNKAEILESQHADKLKALFGELQQCRASWHLRLCRAYLEDLPTPFVATKTDAEGKFQVELPRSERLYLVAQARRQLFGTEELYYWCLWINDDTHGKKALMLSNDNLTKVFPINQALPLVEKPKVQEPPQLRDVMLTPK